MSRKNRDAGHNWERECAILLRKRFPEVTTARYSSKETDDSGIDFVRTEPFSFQSKTMAKGVSYKEVLGRIETGIPVILHKLTGRGESKKSTGKLLVEKGRYAIMPMDNFLDLINILTDEQLEQLARLNAAERTDKGKDSTVQGKSGDQQESIESSTGRSSINKTRRANRVILRR